MVVGQKYNRKDKIIKQSHFKILKRPFNPCFALHENEAKIELFTEEQLRSASFLFLFSFEVHLHLTIRIINNYSTSARWI